MIPHYPYEHVLATLPLLPPLLPQYFAERHSQECSGKKKGISSAVPNTTHRLLLAMSAHSEVGPEPIPLHHVAETALSLLVANAPATVVASSRTALAGVELDKASDWRLDQCLEALRHLVPSRQSESIATTTAAVTDSETVTETCLCHARTRSTSW